MPFTAAPLMFVLIVIGAATVTSASMCPVLSTAVETVPDFNSTSLTIVWFLNRGLNRGNRYGCDSPPSNTSYPIAPYVFASNCGCENWEQCKSRDMNYVSSSDVHYTSPMGECGCCAGWVIFLIVLGSLIAVAVVIATPFVIGRIRRWRKKSKFRATYGADLGRSTDGDETTAVLPPQKQPSQRTAPNGRGVRRRRPAKGAADTAAAPTSPPRPAASQARPTVASPNLAAATPGAFAITIDPKDTATVAPPSPGPSSRRQSDLSAGGAAAPGAAASASAFAADETTDENDGNFSFDTSDPTPQSPSAAAVVPSPKSPRERQTVGDERYQRRTPPPE